MSDDEAGGPRVKRNFPFVIIPEWVLEHPSLDGPAIRIYGLLAKFTHAYPTLFWLAGKSGASVDTVRRNIRKLEHVGAVRVMPRYQGGMQRSNGYELAGEAPLFAEAPSHPREGLGGGTHATPKALDNENLDTEDQKPLPMQMEGPPQTETPVERPELPPWQVYADTILDDAPPTQIIELRDRELTKEIIECRNATRSKPQSLPVDSPSSGPTASGPTRSSPSGEQRSENNLSPLPPTPLPDSGSTAGSRPRSPSGTTTSPPSSDGSPSTPASVPNPISGQDPPTKAAQPSQPSKPPEAGRTQALTPATGQDSGANPPASPDHLEATSTSDIPPSEGGAPA